MMKAQAYSILQRKDIWTGLTKNYLEDVYNVDILSAFINSYSSIKAMYGETNT